MDVVLALLILTMALLLDDVLLMPSTCPKCPAAAVLLINCTREKERREVENLGKYVNYYKWEIGQSRVLSIR